MSAGPETLPPLEEFRSYLLLLAGAQIDHGSAKRIDPVDIVQQTLLKAQQKFDQFRGSTPAELAGWLRAILGNNLKDALRKAGRESDEQALARQLEQSSVRLAELLPANQSTPSHGASRNEQIQRLANALFQLPDDQRRAVELRHLKGLSVAEIAKQMQHSKPSVGGLLQRGLKALRACLEPAGE